MLLVKSKSQGFVGLMISINAIPAQADILTPGKPSIIIQWIATVLVDDRWVQVILDDLIPFLQEVESSEQIPIEVDKEE